MKKRFTGNTRLFLMISGAIIVVALIMQIVGVGLNLGIDFTGGSILEYSVGEDYDMNDVTTILSSMGYSDAQVQKAAPSAASIQLQENLAAEAAAAAENAVETVEETAEEAVESVEDTAEEAIETVEEATDAVEEVAEEAAETVEETVEATEEVVEEAEETAEEAEETVATLLNTDKSNIAADGKTDLQIRLNLVDEAGDMEKSVDAAVKATASGANQTNYAQLTAAAIQANNYDAAYAGGYVLEYDMGGAFDADAVEVALKSAMDADGVSYNAVTVEAFAPEEDGDETSLRILVDLNDVTSQVRTVLEREMRAKYQNFHFISIDHVSAIAGRDLIGNAIKALLIAFVLMLIYIAIRFDPLSGLAALFALFHDVLIMMSFMVFFRWRFQVNSSFIAAVLTIVGYSINNTIIIFDRIRENVKKPGMTQLPKMEIVEQSVASTLSRTINTTITTMITLVCLYIFGIESIKEFGFPLIVGMLAGTYSSVLLSGQVWAMWSEKFSAKKNDKNA